MTRLYRSEDDRILGGVCGGLAEIYGLDPSLVRLAAVLLILSGVTPILYLAAWIVIPPESEIEEEKAEKVEDSSDEENVEEQEESEKDREE